MSARAARPLPELGLLALLATAEFMLTLDLSIVNVALPAIRRDLGFSETSLEWVVNAYALAFAGTLLLGGRTADLFSGRRVFLSALTTFIAASLACGLAAKAGGLVAARGVQGVSAGILAPTTLSILAATYPEADVRERALAIWTAVAIGGGAVGGVLGGVLTSGLSWRWIFFANVPIGALLIALGLVRLPHPARKRPRPQLDVAGALTLTLGLVALVFGLVRSNGADWSSAQVVAAFAAAALLLVSFTMVERHLAKEPLVPFSVFRSRELVAGNVLSFLAFVPVMATWFFLTLYLQGIHRYNAMHTGLAFLPLSLAAIAGSQVGFRITRRVTPRAVLVSGALLAAIALSWVAQLSASTAVVWVIVPAALAMAGGGLILAPITLAAMSVASARAGLAGGLLNTTRQIGGALGLAVLGTIAAPQRTSGGGPGAAAAITHGFASAFYVGAAVFLLTAGVGVLALPWRRGLAQPAGLASCDDLEKASPIYPALRRTPAGANSVEAAR